MISSLLLVALLQGAGPHDPVVLVREIQRAIDANGGRILEKNWRATLARSPREPRALLAVATFERTRYRYEGADSLYQVLLLPGGASSPAFRAMAKQGMALWRSLGTDPARADSLLVEVREEARRAGLTALEAEAVFGLAQLRQRTQGPKVGRQLMGEWWALLERPSAQDTAQRLCALGAINEQLGDTTGIRQLETGAALATRLASWRTAGNCRLLVAQTLDRRGYRERAAFEARRALADFERIRYEVGIALASQWLGYLELQRGKYASSRALLDGAVRAARATRFESVEAWARSGLAELHLTLGDPTAARVQASIAAASHRRRNDRWGMATALSFEATALESAGDVIVARARYSEAIAAFVSAGLPFNSLSAHIAKARMEMRIGVVDSAERTLNAAAVLGKTTEGLLREQPVHRAELAMRRGRLAEADSLIRGTPGAARWRMGDLNLSSVMIALREAQVSLRAGHMETADSAVTAVTAGLEQWRGQAIYADLTGSLAQLRENWGRLSDLYPDVVDQLVQRGLVERAFAFVEQIRARDIVERRLQTAALLGDTTAVGRLSRRRGGAPVASLAMLRRSLSSDEAFVSYTLGLDNDRSTALIVTGDGARSVSFPGRAALISDIERFAKLAAAGTEAVASSRRLGAAVLAPVLDVLPPTVQRVMLSPDQDLHRIPFDALRLPDGRYALERLTISIVPSATVALTLRTLAAGSGSEVLAIGDPRFETRRSPASEDDDTREPGGGGFDGVSLQRLRFSGEEAVRVARYGTRSRVLVGRDAAEGAVRRANWNQVSVAHFATHALVDPESQSRTALALSPDAGTDGFLTPAELATLPLRSPLVVLSACHSLGGQVLGGEGLRGLAAPLLEAGARAVVATHWSIGDRSVVPFVDRFYAAMAAGATVDEALRQTKLAAIRDGVSISDWGGFSVIGDGTMRPRLRPVDLAPIAWVRDAAQARRDTTPP